MTSPDNTAQSWRDLTDQLKPEQVAALAEWDTGDPRDAPGLLSVARDYAEMNLADTAYADIKLPEGATDVAGWEKLAGDGYSRGLVWRTFDGPDPVYAAIDGWQQPDGTFTRHITLWTGDGGVELTADTARETSSMLNEAADELEAM